MDLLIDEVMRCSPEANRNGELTKLRQIGTDVTRAQFVKARLMTLVDPNTLRECIMRSLAVSRLKRLRDDADPLMSTTTICTLSSTEDVCEEWQRFVDTQARQANPPQTFCSQQMSKALD